MIEWSVSGDRLRVTDGPNRLALDLGGGAVDGPVADVALPVEETIACRVEHLSIPATDARLRSLGRGTVRRLTREGDVAKLGADEYRLRFADAIDGYVRFADRATVSRGDASVRIDFPSETRIVAGFRPSTPRPSETITVPDDVHGVATAISHLSCAHYTHGPERSDPAARGHPPLFERGDALSIPSAISTERPDHGIELVVPPKYDALFVLAPLAYYLQARVRIGRTDRAAIRLPSVPIERELSPMLSLERDVERLLRKVVLLDSLLRQPGNAETPLAESHLLDALDADREELLAGTPADRLAAYLAIPDGAIEHRLPDWHLATYVEPDYERVEAIPHLLGRLSLIYTPRTSELEGQELIERSLDDFYRGVEPLSLSRRSGTGTVASVDVLKPELQTGRVHGWLADDVPIDVFKSATSAYANRLSYLEHGKQFTDICVVLNDADMAGERERVASIYRNRAEELPLHVTVEESLRTDALAHVFEDGFDFVHYIGHCETDGFRCPDGHLAASSLDAVRTQTFFLNACGSFYEGRGLVERGSVAGAVTFTKVLNEHAVKVGSTFATLLMHGFSIERAMRLARRRIMMGKDYAVVGDGTHSLMSSGQTPPTTATVEPLGENEFLLALDCYSTSSIGSQYVPPVDTEFAYLCGANSHFTVSRSELHDFLATEDAAVIYDGDLYWSGSLAPELEGDERAESEAPPEKPAEPPFG